MTREDFYDDLRGPKYEAWRQRANDQMWKVKLECDSARSSANFAETATLCDRCGRPVMRMRTLCYRCSQKQWNEVRGRVVA